MNADVMLSRLLSAIGEAAALSLGSWNSARHLHIVGSQPGGPQRARQRPPEKPPAMFMTKQQLKLAKKKEEKDARRSMRGAQVCAAWHPCRRMQSTKRCCFDNKEASPHTGALGLLFGLADHEPVPSPPFPCVQGPALDVGPVATGLAYGSFEQHTTGYGSRMMAK